MGRQGKHPFVLADGRKVTASEKKRGKLFKVQFPHPTISGKYVEAATGVPIPRGWTPKKRPPNDWFTEAHKVISEEYLPTSAGGTGCANGRLSWEEAER